MTGNENHPARKLRLYLLSAVLAFSFLLPACSSQKSVLRSCSYDHRVEGISTYQECLGRDSIGRLYIHPEKISTLKFDSHGLAPVWGEKEGWMYVNREGHALVTGVAAMDNWADRFHDGLVRVKRGGKWGFADREGKEVIPAKYDGALNFENGAAKVCIGCRPKCEGPDCEHRQFTGGDWKCINTKGETVKDCKP